jgi:hypothetical protein
MKYSIIMVAAFAIGLSMAVAAEELPMGGRHVAGSTPQQRPRGTPVIKDAPASSERRMAALAGISEPVPASLKFLNDQGAWYTPFDQPGMPGYYDIRQWHRQASSAKP